MACRKFVPDLDPRSIRQVLGGGVPGSMRASSCKAWRPHDATSTRIHVRFTRALAKVPRIRPNSGEGAVGMWVASCVCPMLRSISQRNQDTPPPPQRSDFWGKIDIWRGNLNLHAEKPMILIYCCPKVIFGTFRGEALGQMSQTSCNQAETAIRWEKSKIQVPISVLQTLFVTERCQKHV